MFNINIFKHVVVYLSHSVRFVFMNCSESKYNTLNSAQLSLQELQVLEVVFAAHISSLWNTKATSERLYADVM